MLPRASLGLLTLVLLAAPCCASAAYADVAILERSAFVHGTETTYKVNGVTQGQVMDAYISWLPSEGTLDASASVLPRTVRTCPPSDTDCLRDEFGFTGPSDLCVGAERGGDGLSTRPLHLRLVVPEDGQLSLRIRGRWVPDALHANVILSLDGQAPLVEKASATRVTPYDADAQRRGMDASGSCGPS